MKKTLAIILSAVMLLCLVPFSAFAGENYDRAAVASDNKDYIASLKEEQIAAVVLDWLDRQIAAVTEDFESFEVEVMGQTIAVDIPEIKGLDDLVAYADYLAELEGDFAKLDVSGLKTLSRENGDMEFIYGIIEFMALNSDIFGKVFHWEEGKVFDYGKVGEYILSLDTTVEENKKIVDFYNDYLIGNDIQEKFIAEIAKEMNYEIPVDPDGERAETFDETISNGIINWFSGLCENSGILSEDGIAALKAYDLRTTDIYTLVENFVGLVQSDNKVKLDTYYNYILDTVVRTMLKAMLGYTAEIGAEADVPAVFNTVYTDLELLEEISGGTVNFKDGDNYYQITVADGVASAKALTWKNTLEVNFEPPVVGVYTGGTQVAVNGYNCDLVQNYNPNLDYTMTIYSAYAEQINGQLGEMPEGMTAEITADPIPEEIAALMTAENARAMKDLFAVKVDMGDKNLLSQVITFNQIAEMAEEKALEAANTYAQTMIGTSLPVVGAVTEVTVKEISIDLAYNGYATEDEFICQVTSAATASIEAKTDKGMTIPLDNFNVSAYIQNPVATIVLDNLSGFEGIEIAAQLPDFLDTDFTIDAGLLDFAGNYDEYNGVVGQVNRVLVGLTDMLLSDAGEEKLNLTEGGNIYLTDNMQKICDTVNEMMVAAEEVMNDAGLQEMLGNIGVDIDSLLSGIDLGILYEIDFSSVEALYVSAINLVLDVIDDGKNETITAIHTAVDGLKNLDAMAVAVTDYAFGECIPVLNEKLGCALAVPGKTDAKAVKDGGAKDIIMSKLVDTAFDAVTWGVDEFLNDTVNGLLAKLELDLPDVEFTFGVDKGDNWEETLSSMVSRVYQLADGIIIACDNEYTDTFDKISAVANAILPLGSLASNCKSENFAFDVNKVLGFMFEDALAGDLEGFLRLFETAEKTEDVAADVPVTKALINASEHIVDSIFPDTVNSEDYEATVTVKEDFTSGDNDVVIASNNMKSINSRKTELVPAALRLVREAGILPYFAKCDKDHTAEDLETTLIPGTAASCTEDGVEDAYACADCGYIVSGGGVIDALGHKEKVSVVDSTCTKTGTKTTTCSECDYENIETIPVKAHSFGKWTTVTEATCVEDGLQKRTCTCEASEERPISATGHKDADGNYVCDVCEDELQQPEKSFFQKIIDFFNSIIEWFKNLFS